jgi:hypothetical protein
LGNSVNEYDLIVVSALGYIDGGFYYSNPISTLTNIAPAGLEVCNKSANPALVSKNCFYQIAAAMFCPGMIGFRFVRQLRDVYGGDILVQPFPMLSEDILNREDWHLTKIYKNTFAANKFMLKIKDEFLLNFCAELHCSLLPYPDSKWRDIGFTPREYMSDHDCLHPTNSYGALVLAQIEDQLS